MPSAEEVPGLILGSALGFFWWGIPWNLQTGCFCISVSFVLSLEEVLALCWPWSHGLQPKNNRLVCGCHQLLSEFLANGHLPEYHVSQLMIKVIMRWNRGVRTIFWHLLYGWGLQDKEGPPIVQCSYRWSLEISRNTDIGINGINGLRIKKEFIRHRFWDQFLLPTTRFSFPGYSTYNIT